jgi:hypothetical protein
MGDANAGLETFPAMPAQASERAALVAPHQPRVAREVGRDDSGEAALFGHSGQSNRRTGQPFAHRECPDAVADSGARYPALAERVGLANRGAPR